MKLILSRKGFDSGCGGCASPVMDDGAMLSLPIPLASAPVRYRDIAWRGETIAGLVEALTRGKISGSHPAHLDPDLAPGALERLAGWRPAFGQVSASQSHLAAQGVGPGDLFLFFGWFRRAEAHGAAGLRFVPGASNEHVIFGWLQVAEVLAVDDQQAEHRRRRPWLASHPHLVGHAVKGNTVYIAAERLILDGRDMGVPGGGAFARYGDALRLTSGLDGRSHWRLPGWLHPARQTSLSYHTDPRKWIDESDTCLLDSVKQGQEFVAAVPDALVASWMDALLPPLPCRVDAAPQHG